MHWVTGVWELEYWRLHACVYELKWTIKEKNREKKHIWWQKVEQYVWRSMGERNVKEKLPKRSLIRSRQGAYRTIEMTSLFRNFLRTENNLHIVKFTSVCHHREFVFCGYSLDLTLPTFQTTSLSLERYFQRTFESFSVFKDHFKSSCSPWISSHPFSWHWSLLSLNSKKHLEIIRSILDLL